MFPPQGQALLHAHLLLARHAIHQKQRVHARRHFDGLAISRIHLHGLDKLTPRVHPTSHVHQLFSADVVAGLIAVGLQDPFPGPQKLPGQLGFPQRNTAPGARSHIFQIRQSAQQLRPAGLQPQ
jgi:hypothetical protein